MTLYTLWLWFHYPQCTGLTWWGFWIRRGITGEHRPVDGSRGLVDRGGHRTRQCREGRESSEDEGERHTEPSSGVDKSPGEQVASQRMQELGGAVGTRPAVEPAAVAHCDRTKLWQVDPDPGPAASPLTRAGIGCQEGSAREVMPPRRNR